ncbi:MAG: hypothetical protein KDD19_14090 [Phaeodactylibacter sp.]|nr:hypothetical protein [Phaeodactylibacter sp.]MCB9051895.1 hypothetical protein [Lewinellaceae bacterium]
MRIFTLLLAITASALSLLAQPALEGGVFLGVSNYQGDFTLNTAPELSESNLAVGLAVRHPLTKTKALRANLTFGKLTGNDANFAIREQRGASFQTTLIELSVMGEWEPFGQNRTDLTLDLGQRLSPYFFAGAGMAFISPKPVFGEPDEAAAEDLNADYSNVQLAVPLGLGLRAGINEKMSLSLELGMRKTLTDYLDGVSSAGKKDTDDWYLFGGAMFLYRIR